jgi:superfamily II RNA helicase
MALAKDKFIDDVSYVIFDEVHYINDIERGYVWEESIIFSKLKVRFLCLSATIPNADEFASWIGSIKRHTVEVIKHDVRSVPLHKNIYDSELGITTLEDIKEIVDIPDYGYIKGRSRRRRPRTIPPSHVELIKEIQDKLPCFFFNFSRKNCQDNALELAKANIFPTNPEITSFVRKKLATSSPEISNLKSTKILRNTLPSGIAFHHAGLLPIIKELVEELFSKGLIKVLYTTETFAVGINMPAKSVCFSSLRKFDGMNFRLLNSKEYFQIAGRAGRRGIDKEGFVYAMVDRRDFDYNAMKKMTSVDIDPIKSQFRLSINTALNLINQHNSYEIDKILRKNFYSFQKYGTHASKLYFTVIHNNFKNTKKKLIKLGYMQNNALTEKGLFSSKIYSDEILFGEIFATNFYEKLNEYQMLMIIACLCYESRERTEFYETHFSKFIIDLQRHIKSDNFLQREKRFNSLLDLTALIHPCYYGKNIFEILNYTNLLEGDVIRFFRQILDRIDQVRKATTDYKLIGVLDNCKRVVNDCMKDIDII